MQLRFQPPDLDIATLELDFHVDCTAPSEDGTMLAVGCKRFENFEGGGAADPLLPAYKGF